MANLSPLLFVAIHPASFETLRRFGYAMLTGFLPPSSLPSADRIIPTPLDLNKLSRDPAQVEANKADPLCPQSGSVRSSDRSASPSLAYSLLDPLTS
jgi:alpha-beta hydrolase superfamily lysophospholipase